MKQIAFVTIGLLALLGVVTLTQPQGFVALPDNLITSINGLFVAVFALGFDWLIGRVPWLKFLRTYQQEWALGVAVGFVTWLQNILPTGFEDVSIKGVAFVLALIYAFVPYVTVRRVLSMRGVQAFL